MKLAIPTETAPGETRVGLTPDVVERLVKMGLSVSVQAGAGTRASFPDAAYREAGAEVIESASDLLGAADLVVKVAPPRQLSGERHEVDLLKEGSIFVGYLFPLTAKELVGRLAARKVTALAMDQVPRISRAQSMDSLSSQATVAGYKAVLLAACESPKFFPMLTTAAGTIPPAKVVVLGAGVAGLQAIATARRLGAQVRAYDIRKATKEQVASLGATFIDMPEEAGDAEGAGGYAKQLDEARQAREREHLTKFIAEADVVITTALIPGKPAPRLMTREMVLAMKPGSVVMDLAAEAGGNCELTRAGETVEVEGVKVVGPPNLPATMPVHASRMYARNVLELLKLLAPKGELKIDFQDEIVKGSCITRDGEVVHEATRAALG